jgi:Fe-S oxidoreductase
MCCGAGGAQMFKEEEAGTNRVNFNRAEQALETGATIIAANCPFCTTMLMDGVKNKEKEDSVQVLDIAEMVAMSI